MSITRIQKSGAFESSYSAPEVIEGASRTKAADIFSFGKLMLYTILQELSVPTTAPSTENSDTGVPTTASSTEHLHPGVACSEVQNRPLSIEQLSQLHGGDTHPVEQLVEWCLQKEPGKRPSASQALEVLTEGWVDAECPYEQLTKMKLTVTAQLLEQSLTNHFQVDKVSTCVVNHVSILLSKLSNCPNTDTCATDFNSVFIQQLGHLTHRLTITS